MREKFDAIFGIRKETEAFPYHKTNKSKASEFSCVEGSSIEIEYLELIKSLVVATKPDFVLETGPYLGYSTIALAAGLFQNGSGQLTSIEINEEFMNKASENLKSFDSRYSCNFVLGRSVDVIPTLTTVFSFVLLDSGSRSAHLPTRVQELKLLKEHHLLDDDCVIVIHDTSRFDERFIEFNKEIDSFCRANSFSKIKLDLSRGCTLLKAKHDKLF